MAAFMTFPACVRDAAMVPVRGSSTRSGSVSPTPAALHGPALDDPSVPDPARRHEPQRLRGARPARRAPSFGDGAVPLDARPGLLPRVRAGDRLLERLVRAGRA